MEDEPITASQYKKNTGKPVLKYVMRLVVLITVSSHALAMCPPRCNCNDDELRATCSNAGLQFVPIQLNPEVKHMNLSHNKVNNVRFTLEIYAHLNTLDISYNQIQKLGSVNFQSQRHLAHLDLSHNNIETLERDVFKGLKSLKSLNLSDNNIENIAVSSFQDLHNLRTLQLSNNNIISFEDDLLKHMPNIRTLILDNNQFLDIPTNNLKYATKLETLSLSNNLLEYINKDSFPSLGSLTYLSLATNVISDMHTNSFDTLSALQYLDLSNNNLTSILTTQLSKLSNLTELSLSGNFFTVIPPVAFRGLFILQRLYLDKMPHLHKIDGRSFVDNIKLEVISLNDNIGIKNLPTRLFHGNPRLVHISILNNGLASIESTHFPLDQLSSLSIAGNPFECNCSLLWLWNLEFEQKNNNESDIILDINKVTCAGPEKLKDQLLINVLESDMRCSLSWIAVAALSVTSTCFFFVILVVLFYTKKIKCGKEIQSPERRTPHEITHYQTSEPNTQDCNDKFNAPGMHEYRALSPWENMSKNMTESLYEQYGYSSSSMYHSSKPHIVYV